MNIISFLNRTGDKRHYYYDYGRKAGQRPAMGIFTYTKPKNQAQKNHNKQALDLIEVKKSQAIIEQQSIGTAYIPVHKFKANFLDYYNDYVEENKRKKNRALENSLLQFKEFLGSEYISPIDITEDLCRRFRQHLLDKYTGETPMGYFARFKRIIKAATDDKYFTLNPAAKVSAKANPSITLKENLEVEEYLALLRTPCLNEEIKAAFIFCCYTGLRWVDVHMIFDTDIKEDKLTTRIIQSKTGQPVILTLHPIAQAIIRKQRNKIKTLNSGSRLFQIPRHDSCNKTLNQWVKNAGIEKHITWSCARLSFSILLQDENVDDATVAYLLGHTTTKQVRRIYKRHRPKDQFETILKLPSADIYQYFLQLPEEEKKIE